METVSDRSSFLNCSAARARDYEPFGDPWGGPGPDGNEPRIPAVEHVRGPYAHDHAFVVLRSPKTREKGKIACSRCGAAWLVGMDGRPMEIEFGNPVLCDLVPHDEYRLDEDLVAVADE